VTNSKEDEEFRKIQFSGKSSYMIAIPKKWVNEMGLETGSQVLVTRNNDTTITIKPKKEAFSEINNEVSINVSKNDTAISIIRKMLSLYVIGYNIIHIGSNLGSLTSNKRDLLKNAVHSQLIGTEIIADSNEGISLQVLLSYPQLNIENAVKRMFLIAKSMHRDAILSLLKLNKDLAKSVITTDNEMDRFSLYSIRQLKMAIQDDRIFKELGLSKPRNLLGYRLIVKSIERIADHASRIAYEVLKINEPITDDVLREIKQLSDFALNLFDMSGFALFKRDYYTADGIVEKAKSSVEIEKSLQSIEKSRSFHTIDLIIDSIRRTAEYASDIAEIVLNMTVEQVVVQNKDKK
jgi:AbrB family looped-hinge helix DNA binding protein